MPHERDGSRALSLVLSGADGGRQLDLGVLAALGVTVAGQLQGFSGRHALFADDLAATVERSECRMPSVLDRIDRHVDGLPADEQPPFEQIPTVELSAGLRWLDLEAASVSTVIWATGYRRSYPWLNVDVRGEDGELEHRRGITAVKGLYALGLRFQHRRKSHFIGGVGEDARFLASLLTARCAAPALLRSRDGRHRAVETYAADVA